MAARKRGAIPRGTRGHHLCVGRDKMPREVFRHVSRHRKEVDVSFHHSEKPRFSCAGVVLRTLDISSVGSIALPPLQLASGAWDNTVKLWSLLPGTGIEAAPGGPGTSEQAPEADAAEPERATHVGAVRRRPPEGTAAMETEGGEASQEEDSATRSTKRQRTAKGKEIVRTFGQVATPLLPRSPPRSPAGTRTLAP